MLGFSIYLNNDITSATEQYINRLKQNGFDGIFTSAHIPEEDPKKYQELLNEAKFEVDDQKKAELYLQAEELVVKSGLIEPTYVEEAPTFVKKYVKNYFVSTVGQVDFSKVYIEK